MEIFRTADSVHIVMELCSGGELFDALLGQPNSQYSEDAVRNLAKEMLSAMRTMHSHSIVHRDIKLENFLFKDNGNTVSKLRLIDFGFSQQ